MNLLSNLEWILKCVFTCNHGRTTPKEGKCHCPDCGRGVIFQWVVMRCEECRQRTDSKITLRQLVPIQRCCANCGQDSFYYDYLDEPSYFQLHRARLIVREEAEYLQGRYQWSIFAFSEKWGQSLGKQVENLWEKTSGFLIAQPIYAPALIAMQSKHPESSKR